MRSFILMQKCAMVNFYKWRTSPQIGMSAVIAAVFSWWNLSGVVEYSVQSGIRIAPWILPHYFSMPIMQIIFGLLTVVLFSPAPFRDSFSQFLEARVGKGIWIRGQALYILEASFVYVLYYTILTVLFICPRIYFTMDWGQLITQLCSDPVSPEEYGITLAGIYFAQQIISACSAPAAMFLTMLSMWLVAVFLGFVIFAFHILFGYGPGILAAGFFGFLAYFSNYVGQLALGNKIFFLSPVNWICLGYWDLYGTKTAPDPFYILAFTVGGSLILGELGIRVYQMKEW